MYGNMAGKVEIIVLIPITAALDLLTRNESLHPEAPRQTVFHWDVLQ